ncbi:MAG: hypothetical protein AAFQ41_04290 [Cyanobacteria bacterium J06623_7]
MQQQQAGVEVFLGDVYQIESKPLVLQFSLPAISTTGTLDLGSLSYTYQQVVDGKIQKFDATLPLSIKVIEEGQAAAVKLNDNVIQQASQLRIAKQK